MEWTPSYQELQDECNIVLIASGVGVCRAELQPNFLSALQVKNERFFFTHFMQSLYSYLCKSPVYRIYTTG